MLLPIVIVLISTVVICADVPAVSCSRDIQPVSLVHRHSNITQQCSARSAQSVRQVTPDSDSRGLLNAALGIAVPPRAIDSSTPTKSEVKPIVLPADMSSITMFLTGLSSLGAWQFVRSARNTKFHLGHMPEWYHTGGPIQVGHVTAIDPGLTVAAMVSICDLPTGQSLQLLLRRATALRLRSQSAPALATPRAPPHLCI